MQRERAACAAAKRIVVKVGTSTLAHASGKMNLHQMELLVRELVQLHHQGHEVILVTSGAIAVGMGELNLPERPESVVERQALAAIGQLSLMHMYKKLFGEYNMHVGQVLLTGDDLKDEWRRANARATFAQLLAYGAVPVVNENDTVAIDELLGIKIGDNDTLSALTAEFVGADLLILLTDRDGLYTGDPSKDPQARLIPLVRGLTPELVGGATGTTGNGTGGMITKIEAAEIAARAGIPMVIANGAQRGVIGAVVSGAEVGTLFLST